MKRASLVGLSVLAVLLTVMVFYLTGHHALSWPGRTVYRVDRLTGEVTTVVPRLLTDDPSLAHLQRQRGWLRNTSFPQLQSKSDSCHLRSPSVSSGCAGDGPLVTSTRCLNSAGHIFHLLGLHHYCLKGGMKVRNVRITLRRGSKV